MKVKTSENQRQNPRAIKVASARCVVFFGLFLIFISPLAICAETLAKYREDVKKANVLVESLIYTDAEEMSPAEFKSYERGLIAEIRASLPPAEKIERPDSTVAVDNRWLHDKLNELEKETSDSPKREVVLTEISERLGSISQKADEPENSSAANRTKDEDKQKLAEILRREEYQKPEEPKESFFGMMWRKFQEWLSDKFSRPNVPAPGAGGFQSLSLILQTLLYALILGAVGFLIYRFAPFFAHKFQTRSRREKAERVILGERVAADERAENLFAEAERLALSGDLRAAIRKGYVALLCELSDRRIIALARHKTNRDYLRDVRLKPVLHEQMHGLTANFERHWYGVNAVETKDWEEFRNEYKKAITN